MRILIAPDSFGGTLTAKEAAEAIASGWRDVAPDDELVQRPLSDGGPGFLDTLAGVLDGRLLDVSVSDPLGRPVRAQVLLVETTAYVESAQACGLQLLAENERDPLRTTSYGVGQLLLAAVEAGARHVIVGLGGSGTNDAGAGMLTALGLSLLDGQDAVLPYGGGALVALERVDGWPALRGVQLIAAGDVDNPLVGPHGASAVFGPQKGADDGMVQLLDAALTRWATTVERDVPGAPGGLGTLPGGGAAGGLGAALLALGASREPGLRTVMRLVEFDAVLDRADLVITGEGSFDSQSVRGKVPGGVAAAAAEQAVPCLVLAGQVPVGRLGRREHAAAGVNAAFSMAEDAGSVAVAMRDPARTLTALSRRVAREWSRG